MGLKRPIEAAEEAITDGVKRSKTLVSWLPDPETCPECGVYMDATTEFVAEQAMPTDIWKCPECGKRLYRDERE